MNREMSENRQSSDNVAMAIAAHPDDIEFYMAGTLLLLRKAGWETHYMNLSSGNLGSTTLSSSQTATLRRREAKASARILGAQWHPPLARDLEIFYDDASLRRLAAVIREVRPVIILTHHPIDYMEDHMNTCRLVMTAAFARGMPNYKTQPPRPACHHDVTVYHATPHMLRDPLGNAVIPEMFVDVSSVAKTKHEALSAHHSQKEWLDASQGMDSYLQAMEDTGREIGRMSKTFACAEGWWKHFYPGYCSPDANPLRVALGNRLRVNPFRKKKE